MSFVEGKCMLRVRLAQEDIANVDEPDVLVLVAPKLAYLPALHGAIVTHFSMFVSPAVLPNASLSFRLDSLSREGAEIPWHFPIGVLSDIVTLWTQSLEDAPVINLVVRFSKSASSSMKYGESTNFAALVLNQLKMSLTIRGIGLSGFNILSKDQLAALQCITGGDGWDGEGYPPLPTFLESYSRLSTPPRQESKFAIKLYSVTHNFEVFQTITSSDQLLITVSDILTSFHFPITSRVRTQGVLLDTETPLDFLQSECSYADGFIHLVISSD